MDSGNVLTKVQAPGLRIPPTRGCHPYGRPEVAPAHACKWSVAFLGLVVNS